MKSYRPMSVAWLLSSSTATSFAYLAAAAATLRLMEMLSRPHSVFRIGYPLLAISALLAGVGLAAYVAGWTFTRNPLYQVCIRPFHIAIMLVKYAAFAGAPVMIAMRRDMEG